ncbi:MAG: ABC transporter ATP-binding protein [Clostridia bacterium]|nr:ABC transporter ATP-binding protein [Clostridia bacterium]
MLNVDNVSVRYGDKEVLSRLQVRVEPGQWWMIAGPNGAGKSTLISAISQGVPYTGKIAVLGRDARDYNAGELARQVGVLSQHHASGYAFTVREVIALGRYAYRTGFFKNGDAEGEERILEAMAATGLTELGERNILTLSGGEMQRVFLAQALAQQPALLMLDEPANHLDLIYQRQLFALIGDWLKTPGRAVISVVHDLMLAKHYGTHALLLREGKTIAAGETAAVLTRQNLFAAYGMDVFAWMQDLLSEWRE